MKSEGLAGVSFEAGLKRMPLGAQESRPRPTAKAYLNSLRHVIAQRVSLIKYAPFFLSLHATSARWGKRDVSEFHTRGGHSALCCRPFRPQLHMFHRGAVQLRYLISSFYIKPQPRSCYGSKRLIVLYRLSTSNHNYAFSLPKQSSLSYIVFLHQTTTVHHWRSL